MSDLKTDHWPDVFLHVLEQDEIWVDRQRVVYRLDGISPSYARNIYNFMLRKARELKNYTLATLAGGMAYYEACDRTHVMAHDELDGEYSRLCWIDAEDWLEGMPLMQRLKGIGGLK